MGSARVDIPAVLALATGTGCMVASVEYRLAPESPYPAAVDDCYAGLEWLSSNAYDLGLAPERIIIEGVSAGGGLAAATTLMARERGGPRIAAQLLCCPMLDDRNDSASAHQMQGAGAWDRTANATGWAAYLGVLAGGPLVPETAAPARASDLTDVPVAFLDVGSAETFRDEVLAYADLLWRSGVSAELHVWPGGCHGFDFLTPDAVLSRQARAARVAWLNRTLTHLSCAKES